MQAGSCWFARYSSLATNCANLYPPGGCRDCLSLVLPLFCFVLFCFRLFAFTKAAALRSIVLRYSICMRPDSHTQLPNNSLRDFSFLFVPFLWFFGDVTFSEYFVPFPFSLLFYGEYVVCFPLPGGVFYVATTGWIFDISLCENSINQSINKSINQTRRLL